MRMEMARCFDAHHISYPIDRKNGHVFGIHAAAADADGGFAVGAYEDYSLGLLPHGDGVTKNGGGVRRGPTIKLCKH